MTPEDRIITYTRQSRNMVRVDRDGAFSCWISRETHKPTGLHAKRHNVWAALIAGREVRSTTLTQAKQKIEEAFND